MLTKSQIARAADRTEAKTHADFEIMGVTPAGRDGVTHLFTKHDFYDYLNFLALQKNGFSREAAAQVIRKHPLNGMSNDKMQRVSYIVHNRRGSRGNVEVTEGFDLNFGNAVQIIDPESFTIAVVLNFAKLKRLGDIKLRSFGY